MHLRVHNYLIQSKIKLKMTPKHLTVHKLFFTFLPVTWFLVRLSAVSSRKQ